MRQKFVTYLKDPITLQPLSLNAIFKEADGHIIDGVLTSKNSWYPIVNGVPRLLTNELKTTLLQTHQRFFTTYRRRLGEPIIKDWRAAISQIQDLDRFLKHQKKTAESFAYEWKYIYKENDYEKQNFFHFLSPFIKENDLRSKLTLDIGCGSGRFTKWAALSGAKVAFGSDLGETVEVAYEMTKTLPNACIIQADIYAMPFDNTFDLAYSIGVLHHLPQPQEGFARLPKVLKKTGRMLIWVYNRRGNGRAIYFYEPLRAVAKHLPKPLLFSLCYLPAAAVQLINYLTVLLKKAGQAKLANLVPFAYYANFPFNMKLNDAFDVLATPKSNYYLVEDVKKWFRGARLKEIRAFEHPEAGITCTGLLTTNGS
ncbi:MAG TPA: class I SAM-dependent methyltransferase [Candidatus Saccharimonadales bacterium]|nr:class I SAM-dependent methyltransferase [Candidatus Saccharimonadales bacterium]